MYDKFTNKLYKIWLNKRHNYKDQFVTEWDDYDVFENWAYDNGYEQGARLKRINPKLPFGPDNCQFLIGKTEYNTPLYRIWVKMKYKSKYDICGEWSNFPNFEVWALSNGYEDGKDLFITQPKTHNTFTGEYHYEWNPQCCNFGYKNKNKY